MTANSRTISTALCLAVIAIKRGHITSLRLVSRILFTVDSVQKCYIGALEVYENPQTLTMLDLMEVNTYKLLDCNVAHHPKETVQ